MPAPAPVVDETPLLTQTRRRQRRFLAIASAIALVGVFCLALVVWRFGGVLPDPAAAPDPVAVADPPAETPPPPPPARQVVAPVPIPRTPEPDAPGPSTPATAQPEAAQTGPAFLTLTSNVRAKVYVNGKAVRGHTPLRQHELEPGTHRIAVVAVSSGERREFTKRFEPGQTVTVKERFEKKRRR